MKNSSEEKNDSSEVSFDSSEEFFSFFRGICSFPPNYLGNSSEEIWCCVDDVQPPRCLEAREVKNSKLSERTRRVKERSGDPSSGATRPPLDRVVARR